MHYDDDRAGPDTENQHYGNDLSEHLRDTRRSIRPGIAVPHTVLLTELDNGSLILQERPNGPRAYRRVRISAQPKPYHCGES